MENKLPLTDEEWEKLRARGFPVQDFLKKLDLFDSIRHVTGQSEFAGIVYENAQKLREAAENVFVEGRRDCVEDLFSRASAFDSVVSDIEDWVSDIREAMDSLEKTRPGRTALLDDEDDSPS
jgi:hypothetical protein